jgi:hypothetical protein
MQNHSEQKASTQDVVPTLAGFLGHYDKEAITAAPATVQEMFNDLMCTHYGDSREYRERIILALTIIADLGNAIEPFDQYTLHNFFNQD